MYIVERIEDRDWVFPLYYEHLARFMLKGLNLSRGSVVLEAGSGKGNVTMPLLSMIDSNCANYICYDLDEGPYKGGLNELRQNLSVLGLRNVQIKRGDVRNMEDIPNASVDVVLANELLCDLTPDGVQQALAEFFRILKPGGRLIHSELSPIAENESQEMAIFMDQMTALKVFPREWFSPPADALVTWMHKVGFTRLHIRYFEETIRFKGEAAAFQVEQWLVSPEFLEQHKGELETHELELPMSQVLTARKPLEP